MGAETYHQLKAHAARAAASAPASATRAASRPTSSSNEAPLELLVEAIEAAGYRPGATSRSRSTRPAASSSRDGALPPGRRGPHAVLRGDGRLLGAAGRPLPDRVARGRHGRGRLGRLGAAHRARSATRLQLVGDDIFVTNPAILRRGIDAGIANSILIKLNQIGTLTETLETIAIAREAGYRARHLAPLRRDRGHVRSPISRSRQAPGQIKTGAPARSERVAKYNQLLRIEEQLGERAQFAGRTAVTS